MDSNMKKLKDMESSFFEKFSEEELEFMAAWEELYYSPEFQEDSRRVSNELKEIGYNVEKLSENSFTIGGENYEFSRFYKKIWKCKCR